MRSAAVYFLPHVPKCAGSTIINHMRFCREKVFVVTEKSERRSLGLNRMPMEKARFLTGHYLPRAAAQAFGGREIREIVLLRDPVSYFQSLYSFYVTTSPRRHRATTMDFDLWYRCQRKNPVSHALLSRYFRVAGISELLMSQRQTLDFLSLYFDCFWFVGSYRYCNLLLGSLSQEFGIDQEIEERNVGQKNFLLSGDNQNRILADNRLDQALYEAWAERLWRRDDVGRNGAMLPSWSQKIGSEISVCLARIQRHLMN